MVGINDRRQHYAEVERQHQKKIMVERQEIKTSDSFGISYSFGNRAERRKLAKKYGYTKV